MKKFKRLLSLLLAACLIIICLPLSASAESKISFTDVKNSDYFYKAVMWAVENGITGGMDETHFGPQVSCTRAQAVTFLWNAANRPEPQGNGSKFTDVKPGSYYEKAVQWAVENNITGGMGDNTFGPDFTCTRAQIVTFLYHAANSPAVSGSSSFSDVKSGSYYENAVKWAVENKITSGTGNGKFSPYDNCIRSQIVTFLYRFKVGPDEQDNPAPAPDTNIDDTIGEDPNVGDYQDYQGGDGWNDPIPDDLIDDAWDEINDPDVPIVVE